MTLLNNSPGVRAWFGGLFRRPRLDRGATVYPFDQQTTPMGGTVSVETALKLSAVWACVKLRGETISTLPLHLYDRDHRLAAELPLYALLHDAPNADMAASEFWQMIAASLDLWGNAYALIVRAGGRVVALDPLDPQAMRVARDDRGAIVYRYDKRGYDSAYSEDEILHLRGFTLDGLTGLSPIQYAAHTIGAQIDLNKASANDWKNGLKIGAIFKFPSLLTEEQRTVFRKNLARYQDADTSDNNILLENGIDAASAEGIRINPKDAQMLESRVFGIEEICRAFGVPPQLIGSTDKASSWASSLEGMNQGFLDYSLRPTLVRIEQTLARKLLTPAERGRYRAKFAVEGLLRANSGDRANFYSQMVQNGIMSRNEVRRLEDLPPVAGGDALTVQLNLTELNNLGHNHEL